MELYTQLYYIQKHLKATKDKKNDFGGYKYRSAESILEAVKPMLAEGFSVILSDDLVNVGDRNYVKATASLTNGTEAVFASAYACEPSTKKGMDASQITGAASSYARKYAMSGLFAIDDNKDADTNEHHTMVEVAEDKELLQIENAIAQCDSVERLEEYIKNSKTKLDGLPEHKKNQARNSYGEKLKQLKGTTNG